MKAWTPEHILGVLANEVFFERMMRCDSPEALRRLGSGFREVLGEAGVVCPDVLATPPLPVDLEFHDGTYSIRRRAGWDYSGGGASTPLSWGILMLAAKQFSKAQSCFARSPSAWGDLLAGFACSQQGLTEEAETRVRRGAASLRFGWARALLGTFLLDRRDVAGALREIAAGEEQGPAHGWLQFARGRALLAAGEQARARRMLSAALRGRRAFAAAALERGALSLARGEPAAARASLAVYLRAGPRFAQPFYQLAVVEGRVRRRAAAIEAALEGARLDRAYVWERNQTSVASANRHHGLPRVLWDLAEHPKAPPALLAWRGQTRLLGKDPLSAVGDLGRARSADPRDAWTRLWLAEAFRRLGFFTAALRELDGAHRSVGPWAPALRGGCCIGLGRWQEALRHLDAAIGADAQCGRGLPFAWRAEARLRLRAPGVEEDFAEAAEWNPHWTWLKGRSIAAAGPAFSPGRIMDGTGGSPAADLDPMHHKALASARFAVGDWSGTVAAASRVLEEEMSPWDPWAFRLRARAKQSAGDPSAREDLARARVLESAGRASRR